MNKCQNCQLELQCDHEDCLKSEILEMVNPTRILTLIPTNINTNTKNLLTTLNEIEHQNDSHDRQIWINYFESTEPGNKLHKASIWSTCLNSKYMRNSGLCSMTHISKITINAYIDTLFNWLYKETPGYNVIQLIDIDSNISKLKVLTRHLIEEDITSLNIDTKSEVINKQKFLKVYPTRDLAEIKLESIKRTTNCNYMDAFNYMLFDMSLIKVA